MHCSYLSKVMQLPHEVVTVTTPFQDEKTKAERGCHMSKATQQEMVKLGFKLRPDHLLSQTHSLNVAMLKDARGDWGSEGRLSA